jgi:hypothetical protein
LLKEKLMPNVRLAGIVVEEFCIKSVHGIYIDKRENMYAKTERYTMFFIV